MGTSTAVSFQVAPSPHAMPSAAASKLVFAAFAVILALKLGVLALFGPASQPDTYHYVRYADAILSGEFWHVDLNDPMPITLTRMIGYPAAIAAAKIVFGRDWAVAVVAFQFAASLWASAMVYRLARAFRLGVWLSLGVVAAHATSMQFVVDQAVLTDSLAGSIMTIAMCILGLIGLRRTAAPLPVYLGAGVLIAAAFLIRDVVAYLALGLIPLALAAAMTERSWWRSVAAVGLVFLPLIATNVAYREWNRARVGSAVAASITQAALIGALIEAAHFDHSIFAGSTPIDEVGRPLLAAMEAGQHGYEAEANIALHRDYGWDAVRMNHEVTLAYLRAWRDHPYAMIRHVLYHMSEQQLHQAVRPIETIRDVILWNTGQSSNLARERVVLAGDWRQIPAMIVNWIVQTISVFVFLAFAVVTPIRLVREGWNAETGVSIGIWCYYMAVGFLYAAVHLEPRYLTPVVAGSIVVGTVNIVRVIEFWHALRAAKLASKKIAG
jgi:4-amino-4-deoxy-L-arabinose transferase-like glycosyltransferase